MLKQIVLVFGFIALATHCQGHTKDEAKEGLKAFGASCDPQPTEADLEAFVNMDPNPPKTAKCFMSCLMNQTTLVVDAKLDVEMLKSFMSMGFEGKDAETEKIGKECRDAPQNGDPCEQAFELSKCVLKGMEANGMEVPKLT